MNVTMKREDNVLYAAVSGEVDALTAPALKEQLIPALEGIERLELDFAELEYISSAGLRVLLTVMQIMKQDTIRVKNVSEDIRSVLDLTGFSDDLNIE